MSQLKYFDESIRNRAHHVDEFLSLYPESNVFSDQDKSIMKDYFDAFKAYYDLKPFIRSYVDTKEDDNETSFLLGNNFFDKQYQARNNLESLRDTVIKKLAEANKMLDDVGFKIVQFLGSIENQFHIQEGEKDCVCLSLALGEECAKYFSIMAQKSWISVINPIKTDNDDLRKVDQPLYLFSKSRMALAPVNDDTDQVGDNGAANNNNM